MQILCVDDERDSDDRLLVNQYYLSRGRDKWFHGAYCSSNWSTLFPIKDCDMQLTEEECQRIEKIMDEYGFRPYVFCMGWYDVSYGSTTYDYPQAPQAPPTFAFPAKYEQQYLML